MYTEKEMEKVYGIRVLARFGLYRREQPDMAIVKDLNKVKVEINQKDLVYNYNQRYEHKDEIGDGYEIGVKFGNRYGNMKYTRPIYKADAEFLSEDQNRELKVYVTYRIALKNKSTTLGTRINNIIDYYDNKYELVGVGTQCAEDGNVTNALSYRTEGGTGKYNKAIIDTSSLGILNKQQESILYVRLRLNREQVYNIISNSDEELENVIEIGSYTVYSGGSLYGGVDKNSNPGSCAPGNKDTYEDDTDASPGLQLVEATKRAMDGLVFYDNPRGELLDQNIREGDGVLSFSMDRYGNVNLAEKLIQNVKVELLRKELRGGNDTWIVLKTFDKTQEDGQYMFEDFAAGDYRVRFIWGQDITWEGKTCEYVIQNCKGTIFNESTHKYTENSHTNGEWYKNDLRSDRIRESDAIDYYTDSDKASVNDNGAETRLSIDEEYKTVKYYTPEQAKASDKQMSSITPEMSITVEYDEPERMKPSDGSESYNYPIRNVDFGIIERPRQNYEFTKNIDRIKLTLENGQILIDSKVDPDDPSKLIPEAISTTAQPPVVKNKADIPKDKEYLSGYPNGYVKIEMDNEIIHGAKLDIWYKYVFTNTGEVDYVDEGFYKYGTKATPGRDKALEINASNITDYLDRELVVDEEESEYINNKWTKKEKTALESQDVVTDSVLGNAEVAERRILQTDKLNHDNDGLATVRTDKLNWNGLAAVRTGQPKESATIELLVTKTLQTINNEDVELDNDAEIVTLTKNGGGIPVLTKPIDPKVEETITPGNYEPKTAYTKRTEPDDDRSQTIIITPNTGGNLGFIIPVLIGIGALAIITVGTIVIKKKVLRKE